MAHLSSKRINDTWGPCSGAPQRIECLEQSIRRVMTERQALHEHGAGRNRLESNRLEIGRLNRQLAKALIDHHNAHS
jgi:hypothetical protein